MINNKLFISLPYIYPVCPLNINHARMFVVGDICARYYRYLGRNVYFPIASHYSGNTAHKISNMFSHIYLSTREKAEPEEDKMLNLFTNIYKTPDFILKTFTNPLRILDYYSQEILWELKSLNVSCDYKDYYTTKSTDFSAFVRVIVSLYRNNDLLINDKEGLPALDYDKEEWKVKMLNLLRSVEYIQPFHRNNILSAVKNVRSDWSMVKDSGFGVKYDNRLIIDPMFDSELFTLFDLFVRSKNNHKDLTINNDKLFEALFSVLHEGKKSDNIVINEIVEWLPCDLFIAEEHLKNWIVKRMYSESLLIDKKYQTKKYYILGMGLLDGKRMSASKGHAIFAKDLIDEFGSMRARLVIILAGGHPSKMYNYDKSLPTQADKLLNNFNNYFFNLLSIVNNNTSRVGLAKNIDEDIRSLGENIEKNIRDGYYQQAIIELFSKIPQKYKSPNEQKAMQLLDLYTQFTEILLPGAMQNFNLPVLESK